MDMSEQFWTGMWRTVAAAAVAIALIMGGCNVYSTSQFVQGGYYHCTLPGSTGDHWCK